MSRRQQRSRRKQSDQEKSSGLNACCPMGQITYPKSIQEFLSSSTNSRDCSAFQKNFEMFLTKYKDESSQIVPNKLKHVQRLVFAKLIANGFLNDTEIGPNLAKIGGNFSSEADPNFKCVDDLLEGFEEAETVMSYFQDLVNKDQTVHDYLSTIYWDDMVNFVANARRALEGSIVTTRFNNKSHKFLGIDIASTPGSTIINYSGEEISLVDYFKRQYDIDIKDPDQPLLVCREMPDEGEVCLEKPEDEDEQGAIRYIIPELMYTAGAMSADLRVKKRSKEVVMNELIVSAYRRMVELLDLDLIDFKVFREGLHRKERERWDKLVDQYNDNWSKIEDGRWLYLTNWSDDIEQVNIEKEIEDIIASARHNIQNEDIDEVVNYIEGKSLGAVPKQENKETSFKSKKKEKNPEAKCKKSGYKGNNRKKTDRKSKDMETNNNSLIEESTTSKELTDETENQLKEGKLMNSQVNFKVTSEIQESDLLSEPLKDMPRRDPKEIREEVRDQYIKDIVEVNEKIENVKQELTKNAEKKAKELEVLKTKQDEEKVNLDEESGREMLEVQEEMDKLKQEMSRIKDRMAKTEAKRDRKKQNMSARHAEENEALKEKYTDQESEKALAELKKASAQLTEDMNKLDIDPNVVKQVDGAREKLECPICMEIMSPPMKIWMCSESHCVCEKCKSLLPGNLCPTCRTNKVNIRARIVEDLARALFKQ